MPLSREDILAAGGVRAELPQREVPFAPLKGDVIVRGLWLEERLAHQDEVAKLREQLGIVVPPTAVGAPQAAPELSAFTNGRLSAGVAVSLLSYSVVGADGKPLLTRDEWRVLASAHVGAVLELCGVAMELAGLGPAAVEAAAKN